MEKRKKNDLDNESESTKSAKIQLIIFIIGTIIMILIYILQNLS